MQKRLRIKQQHSLTERLVQEAERIRSKAESLPRGFEGDKLTRKARQLETASRIDEWLSSPGLQVPQ